MALDIGVVLQTNPPALDVVDQAVRADELGFSHVWTFDSHVLWQEPYVIYSQILGRTEQVTVGRWSPTPAPATGRSRPRCSPRSRRCSAPARCAASAGATRPVATRATGRSTLAELRHVDRGHPRPGAGRGGRRTATPRSAFPWWPGTPSFEVWMAAYGPKALALCGQVADGFILQLADPDVTAWMVDAVREAAERRRARPRRPHDLRGRARLRRRRPGAHARPVPVVRRHGRQPRRGHRRPATAPTAPACPRRSPTTSRAARATTTPSTAGPATPTPSSCPTRSSTASASSARSRRTSSACAELEALGVDQFAVYLQHDAMDETLEAYGASVIPALRR